MEALSPAAVSLFGLWLGAGKTALELGLLQKPVTSVTGEVIFPPGFDREPLFSVLPFGVGREFLVETKGRRMKVVFSIHGEEILG